VGPRGRHQTGGKSHFLRVAAITYCAEIPNLQVYLFRRLSEDIDKNHLSGVSGFPSMLAEWVDAGHVKINYSKRTITFWNGSKIQLASCQYSKDLAKYQGAEIGLLLVDELTHFLDDQYRFLRGRLRLGATEIPEKYKGLFPRIICGSNPGSIGHNWVRAAFVDPAPPMAIVQQSDEEGGLTRQLIPALLQDNPTLMQNDPQYLKRLMGLGNPALIKAMATGDWDIAAGGLLDDLWSPKHHVLRPFAIPPGFRIDRSFDWGSTKPFAALWFAESDGSTVTLQGGEERTFPRGSVFIISEWYGSNGKPNEGIRMINAEIARGVRERDNAMGRIVHPGPADNAIFNVLEGTSIADDMARAPHYVRWTRSDKSPGSRINGWEVIRKMLKQAIDGEMPGLYVFDTCRHTIRTLPTLPRHASIDGDVDSDSEDHIGDAVRYRVSKKTAVMQVQGLPI
jgi:hypothetical protein